MMPGEQRQHAGAALTPLAGPAVSRAGARDNTTAVPATTNGPIAGETPAA
jgi:hypothetical protein